MQNQRKQILVRNNGDFEINEFELTEFNCNYLKKISINDVGKTQLGSKLDHQQRILKKELVAGLTWNGIL